MEKTPKKGQACKAARTRQQAGQPEWDWQNKTARTNYENRTASTGLLKKGIQGRTEKRGQQNILNRTAVTVQQEQVS
jgi:hypothetical protein